MRVSELINELQKYPLDAFVKMSITKTEEINNCPGYNTVMCTESEISDTYYKKDEKYPMTGILYLRGDTKITIFRGPF